MDEALHDLKGRVHMLERGRRRERMILGLSLAAAIGFSASRPQESGPAPSLEVRELIVVDAKGTTRVRIGAEDDTQRKDNSAGIVLFDAAGDERGGMLTFDDGSAVIALDAPAGVGAPMRDRAAMVVAPDGSASVKLIDNRTAIPVRMVSDAEGGGGLEFLEYDLEARTYTVIRQGAEGTNESTHDLDG